MVELERFKEALEYSEKNFKDFSKLDLKYKARKKKELKALLEYCRYRIDLDASKTARDIFNANTTLTRGRGAESKRKQAVKPVKIPEKERADRKSSGKKSLEEFLPDPPEKKSVPDIPISWNLDKDSFYTSLLEPEPGGRGLYELALESHVIRFKESFETLVCLSSLTNVRSYWYQEETAKKVLKRFRGRALLSDEVGLGKTIEAGMIYKEIDKRNEVDIALIVVPSSLTLKWRNEMLMRFNEEFEIYRVNEFKRFLQEYKSVFEGDISSMLTRKMIVSYHTLRDEEIVKMLEETPLHIDVLIMDEAHTFRNRETSTFDGAERVCSLAENILFLSATPVQNNIMDLFNILSLLDEDSFMDEGYFLESIRPNALLHQVIAKLKNHEGVFPENPI